MQDTVAGGGARDQNASSGLSVLGTPGLDAQFAELLEAVWTCERAWKQEDRIDAVLKLSEARGSAPRARI